MEKFEPLPTRILPCVIAIVAFVIFGIIRADCDERIIAHNDPPLRVVLMPFACEDNSYKSTLAANDLAAVVQAELAQDPGLQWVERTELEKATRELGISRFGSIGGDEVLRGGRWLKADWAVYGRITTNNGATRTIQLEVVDLQHADVLAETNLSLTAQSPGGFRISERGAGSVTSAIRTLLSEARDVHKADQGKTLAAVLFFSPTLINDGFSMSEMDLQHALESLKIRGKPVHFIRFQRSSEAMDESGLVLNGFAQSDPNAWADVAELYIWGTYSAQNEKKFDTQTRAWVDVSRLVIKLTFLDCKSEPEPVDLIIRNELGMENVSWQIARAFETNFVSKSSELHDQGVRQRVAASLVQRFETLHKENPNLEFLLESAGGRADWLQAVQILETACFFDPGNAVAREKWLKLRWGKFVSFAARNEFSFARRKSEAWKNYVDQFGFKSSNSNQLSMNIATEYVLSAWRPFEMFNYAPENQREWGIPADAGLQAVTEWKNQFGSEFAARVLNAPDNPALLPHVPDFFYALLSLDDIELRARVIEKLWPQFLAIARNDPIQFDDGYIPALRRHFQEIGKAGGEKKLLAELDAANQKRTVPQPDDNEVVLPHFSDFDAETVGDLFAMPQITFSPPVVSAAARILPFPRDKHVKRVNEIVCAGNTLWIAAEEDDVAGIESPHELAEKDISAVRVSRRRLWRLDAERDTPEPATGPIASNVINCMLLHSNKLWMALDDAGIAAYNFQTGAVERYQKPSGIASTNQFAIAATETGMAAIGGLNDFLFLTDGAQTWRSFKPALPRQNFYYGGDLRRLTAGGNKLLLYNSQLLLCDLSSNAWTRVADKTSADRWGRINQIVSDNAGRFWIAADAGLIALDGDSGKTRTLWVPISPFIHNTAPPGTPELAQRLFHKDEKDLIKEIQGKMDLRKQLVGTEKEINHHNRYVPASRLPEGVLRLASDGEFLWMLLPHAVLLYHASSRCFVGGFSLDETVNTLVLAVHGDDLWIGGERGDKGIILRLDAKELRSIPRERWVSETISQSEIVSRLASVSPRQRAIYHFFTSDDEDAIRELEKTQQESLDAESMFMLIVAFSETGQATKASHFKDELKNRYPSSLFLKVLDRVSSSPTASAHPNQEKP